MANRCLIAPYLFAPLPLCLICLFASFAPLPICSFAPLPICPSSPGHLKREERHKRRSRANRPLELPGNLVGVEPPIRDVAPTEGIDQVQPCLHPQRTQAPRIGQPDVNLGKNRQPMRAGVGEVEAGKDPRLRIRFEVIVIGLAEPPASAPYGPPAQRGRPARTRRQVETEAKLMGM